MAYRRAVKVGGGSMITFLLGFTLGIIFGVVGLACAAIMYDKHHPDDWKGERYADKEQKAERLRYSGRGH